MNNTFTLTSSGHIVSVPTQPQEEYSLLLIFPGIPPYGGEWMKTVVPDFIYEKYVVVFSKEFNSLYKEVLDESTTLLLNKNFKIVDKSLFGFSGGGIRCQENMSIEDWTMIGLIDPSCSQVLFETTYPSSKINMIYNPNNWGGSPILNEIKLLQPQVANKIDNDSGYTEACSLAHLYIPTYFFTKIFLEI